MGLNCVPPPAEKQFKEMSDNEFTAWLSSINFEEFEKLPRPYIIQEESFSTLLSLRSSVMKTDTLILPLSLEE